MDVNYGKGRPYSLGVEEEFQLLDPSSFALVSRIDAVLRVVEGEEVEPQIKPELHQSVVEAATTITPTVAEAIEELRGLRARLRDAAAEQGALIASAGTHPFSRHEDQEVTERPRYLELVEEYRWIIVRQLIFGLHVHVGLDSADKAIACVNAARTFVPELLALSANSPFWEGNVTGLASTRIKVFDGLLRSGLPPTFGSFREFERLVDRAAKTNAFPDHTRIWWDVRPNPAYGTVEIRICDAQTRLENVAAIVALAQSLVATLGEAFDRGERLPVETLTLIEENKWRASRYGLDGNLIDLARDTERPTREAVRELVERCRPAARKLACMHELDCVDAVLERGTGAAEQRAVYKTGDGLRAVSKWVADETVRDV